MQLSDLKVGQTWYLDDPARVGRIIEETTAKFQEPILETWVDRKAFKVRVTLPVQEITGLVTAREAQVNRLLSESITKGNDHATDTFWFEVWSERMVPRLVNYPGKPAQLKGTDKKFAGDCVTQLFCCEVEGRHQKRNHTSPVVNKAIDGKVVAPSMIVWPKKEAKVQEASGTATAASPVVKAPPRKRKRRSDAGKARRRKESPQEVTA